MIGVIPNPKKSFELDFSTEQVLNTILFIPLKNSKYKFTSKNDVFKTVRFEATEFLSLGVFIDVNVSSISDTKCKIEIEISRKLGSFDKSFEVQKANEHLNKIATLISECITLTPEEVELLEKNKKAVSEKKGCGKPAAVFVIITIVTAASLLF